MKVFVFLIPVFMSFTDCDKPREPAKPLSDPESLVYSKFDVK